MIATECTPEASTARSSQLFLFPMTLSSRFEEVRMQVISCRVCGGQPAQRFVIRRHVGMLLLQRFVKVDAPLCGPHAEAIAKEFLGKTLVQGWWGITSFFFNIFAVIKDFAALQQARKLAALATVTAPARPD
jgi:hypothetical protein